MTRDERFMQEALMLARQALDKGEVPVGAVIVQGERIIGRGFNRRETEKNALRHAELEAIDEACKSAGGWRLFGCELFVTLEPCPMCAGAVINSRIKRVVYGASDKKAGSCGSVTDLFALPYNHKPEKTSGVLEAECAGLLSEFFASLRLDAETGKSASGVIFCTEDALLTDGTESVLRELHGSFRIFVLRERGDLHIGSALAELIDGKDSPARTGLTKAEALRLLIKRNHLRKAVCIGTTDADRQAAQTCGVPFIHFDRGKGRVRSFSARITGISELPDIVRRLIGQDT